MLETSLLRTNYVAGNKDVGNRFYYRNKSDRNKYAGNKSARKKLAGNKYARNKFAGKKFA